VEYFWEDTGNGALQGDVWSGLRAIDYRTRDEKAVSGLIVSNSCDIDPSNNSARQRNVLFCPLIGLDQYFALLAGAGRSDEQISSTAETLRRQETTYALYLPAREGAFPEAIALLDDIQLCPLDVFDPDQLQLRARLSQLGFYILIIKLAIHFTRVGEGVRRFP
jgi:hypothetical protein